MLAKREDLTYRFLLNPALFSSFLLRRSVSRDTASCRPSATSSHCPAWTLRHLRKPIFSASNGHADTFPVHHLCILALCVSCRQSADAWSGLVISPLCAAPLQEHLQFTSKAPNSPSRALRVLRTICLQVVKVLQLRLPREGLSINIASISGMEL